MQPAQLQSDPELWPREPPSDGERVVTIRYRDGDVKSLRLHEPSADLTAYMAHLLRNRRLWRDVPDTLRTMAPRCANILQHLGLDTDRLRTLGLSGVLEIGIDPGLAPAAHEFPWEFTLAEATRSARRLSSLSNRAFVVIRHFPGPAGAPRDPRRVLVVESAPGRVAELYDFESERQVVRSSLQLDDFESLVGPDLGQLTGTVTTRPPDIIHLTGVDAIQGAEILRPSSLSPLELPTPGMYFRDGRGPVLVTFDDLAQAMVPAGSPPVLVGFNIYNSVLGAAAVVKQGALNALAFQSDVDDTVAEQFFAAFYTEWKRAGWDVVEGFRRAWLRLGSYGSLLRGTGIVLWSRLPVLAQEPERARRAAAAPPPAEQVVNPADVLNPREHIGITFTKADRLNYSLLHNGESLFTKFTISRLKPGIHTGVTVQIKLYAGLETAQYEASFQLGDDQPTVDVNQRAKVPLTSQLTRSLAESVFTTISFCVRWGDHIIDQQTERVELLPIDEWQDDDLNRKWLPSFVLPRDPAVRRIIDAAQRYLVAVADDSGAGFDGYQSYDPDGATLDERCRYIDAQVRALWWALVVDFPLGYINPPPTFTESAQRLRTPSDVIAGKRGTCIDLALLLAAPRVEPPDERRQAPRQRLQPRAPPDRGRRPDADRHVRDRVRGPDATAGRGGRHDPGPGRAVADANEQRARCAERPRARPVQGLLRRPQRVPAGGRGLALLAAVQHGSPGQRRRRLPGLPAGQRPRGRHRVDDPPRVWRHSRPDRQEPVLLLREEPDGVPHELLHGRGHPPVHRHPAGRLTPHTRRTPPVLGKYHTGSDVLGVLIARASGQPLETFFRERIFEPLGMKDTGFSVPAAKLDRLASCSWTTEAPPPDCGLGGERVRGTT